MEDKVSDIDSDEQLLSATTVKKKPLVSVGNDPAVVDCGGEKGKSKKKRRKKHRGGKNRQRKYIPKRRRYIPKRRRYIPYHKLNRAQQEETDKRIEKRANRTREYLHSLGVSLAPPNTTQFLVNDNIEANPRLKKLEDNSDGSYQSDGEEYDVETDDFNVMWNGFDESRFDGFSRSDLAIRYLDLEDQIEQFADKTEAEDMKIRVFQEEVRRYENENEILTKLNAKLVKKLEDMSYKDEKVLKNFNHYKSTCRLPI